MLSRPGQRRAAFTLIELVVVVMILGIIAAIAAMKLLGTADGATDNGARQTLSVIRSAIDSYAAEHPGDLPGADGSEATFKADIAAYIRGGEFPECPVGEAGNNVVRMFNGNATVESGISGSEATHGWAYNYETGNFHINSDDASNDGSSAYHEF